MQHRRALLCSNLILTLVALLALLDASVEISGRNPGFRVYSLERRGVITMDDNKARKMNPQFDDVYRAAKIGRWIAANHIATETLFGACGLVCAAINFHVLCKN